MNEQILNKCQLLKERDLKNIRQIGNPTEDDKIYIENAAYARIHEEDYAQKTFELYIQNFIKLQLLM